MEKIVRKEMTQVMSEKEVTLFKTSDGKEFRKKEVAKEHEALLKKYPKLSSHDIEWMECFSSEMRGEEIIEDFEKTLHSNKVIVLLSHSGGDHLEFEAVEPYLVAVKAVIKALHRRTVGCNYNMYVDGIIYKCESLCFDDEKKEGGGYFQTGKGRNIKKALQNIKGVEW